MWPTRRDSGPSATQLAGEAEIDAAKVTPAVRITPLTIVLVAVWIGLVAGFLDLGQVVLLILKNRFIDGQGLYRLGRDFLWIIPLGVAVIVLVARVDDRFDRGRTANRSLLGVGGGRPLIRWFPRVQYEISPLVLVGGLDLRRIRHRVSPICPATQPWISHVVSSVDSRTRRRLDYHCHCHCWRLGLGGASVARIPSWAACRREKRALDRMGYGTQLELEHERLSSANDAQLGSPCRPRGPVRSCLRGCLVDPTVACKPLYRTLAARAPGRLEIPAGRHPPDARRVSWFARL